MALTELLTVRVVMVKLALIAPLATVTVAGTSALVLLQERTTIAPPLGAPLLSVTVPCDVLPPVTLAGLSVRDDKVAGGGGGGTGRTVSVAVRVVPLKVAEMVTLFVAATVTVLIVKVALVAPAGIVTLAGVEATPGLLLDNVTTAPPLGAAVVNVTVPCEVLPPTRLVGFSAREERVGAAGVDCGVKRLEDDQFPAVPAELRARTRHQCCTVDRPVTLTCETVEVRLRTSGAEKLLLSST